MKAMSAAVILQGTEFFALAKDTSIQYNCTRSVASIPSLTAPQQTKCNTELNTTFYLV